jgi:hypothetical protein
VQLLYTHFVVFPVNCSVWIRKYMPIKFHPHALERMEERNATEDEVIATIEEGEQFPAKFGRAAFRTISILVLDGVAGLTKRSR